MESRPPLPLRRELLTSMVATEPGARAEQPRGRGRGGKRPRTTGGRGGGRAGGRGRGRLADRSHSPPPLAESPAHRMVPEQQTEAPEQQQEAPEQQQEAPVQPEAPEQQPLAWEARWDDSWEACAAVDDDDGEDEDEDVDGDSDGGDEGDGEDEGAEGSSSSKKPVYRRGMTRLPSRPDPAQRSLIAPDGEK